MGVCLCKDKIDECSPDNSPDAYGSRVHSTGADVDCSLSETVDRLVKETLEVISTIVDKYVLYKLVESCVQFVNKLCFSEPEPPNSMVQLHDITDKPVGWIQLVKSLIRVVPIE